MIGKYLTERQTAPAILSVLMATVVLGGAGPRSTLAQTLPASSTRITAEASAEGISFHEGETPVLFYQVMPRSKDGQFTRANYVHPLHHLDGSVITEDFPEDHPHQRGIFWAWHQVKVGDQSAGDSWLTTNFAWHVNNVATNQFDDGSAEMKADLNWSSPDVKDQQQQPAAIVNETTRIHVHPRAGELRNIDFEIRLTALLENVSIGGSDDNKGYGGFSCRFRLPESIQFRGDKSGVLVPTRESVDAGDWVDAQGKFGEHAKTSGVAILVHPSSAGYPQRWILREKDSMQNPVYPGRTPVPLKTDSATVLRYRLVLHAGSASVDQLKQWHKVYATIEFDDPEKDGD